MNCWTKLKVGRHLRAGLAAAKKHRFELALVQFRKAVALDAANAHAHLHLARTLAAKGDFPAAVEAASGAVEMRPDSPSFLILAGEVYFDAGRLKEADELLARALRISPHNDLARAYRVLVRWRMTGDITFALRLSDEGIPDSPSFMSRLLETVEARMRPTPSPAQALQAAAAIPCLFTLRDVARREQYRQLMTAFRPGHVRRSWQHPLIERAGQTA